MNSSRLARIFLTLFILSPVIFIGLSPELALRPASALSAVHSPDYNGDGYADLAIGAPEEDIGAIGQAGGVNVIYGSPTGLSSTFKPDQFWSQSSGGINDDPEQGDKFGSSLAHGDFNGDGYDDLAIGVPGEDIGIVGDSGAVVVIYGSSAGLKSSAAGDGSGRSDQFWHQNANGMDDSAEAGDSFGHSVAAGDLNGDNYDDLAVGIPGETVGSAASGAASVIYGSPTGLSASAVHPDQIITQLLGNKDGDSFAWAVAMGDFDNDGNDDLAIGVPGRDASNTLTDTGAVHVLEGSPAGLSPSGSRMIRVQGEGGFDDSQEVGDGFGTSLVTSDFNGDDFDDLAIGAPFEDIVTPGDNAGAVTAVYGSSGGLSSVAQVDGTGAPDQFWHQFNPSEISTQGEPVIIIQHPAAQLDDQYGFALSAGDFDNDGNDDLAIGVPGESVAGIAEAGSVNMLYGSEEGLQDVSPHDQNWHQNSSGVKDAVETGDRLGGALASADFNGDGYDDLAMGVANEDVSAIDAGAVNVIHGSGTTLRASPSGSTPDDQFWSQNSSSVNDTCESGDLFGFSLA